MFKKNEGSFINIIIILGYLSDSAVKSKSYNLKKFTNEIFIMPLI